MDKYYFYRSYYEALKGLKAPLRYALRECVDRYMFEGIEPVFNDPLATAIWALLLPTLHKSKIYFANGKLKSKFEANIKQNESKTEANPKQNGSKSEANSDICSCKEKEKEKDKEIKEKESKEKEKSPAGDRSGKPQASPSPVVRFIPPTLDEVKAYVQEKGFHFDPEAFYAFYASKGWKVGNTPMKSWRMACVTWEKREPEAEQEQPKPKPIPKVSQCPQCGSYDMAECLDRVMCRGCGAMYDYSHAKGKWERVQ